MLCRLTCRPRGAADDAWVRRHPAIGTTRSSPKGSVGGCHTASQDVSDPPDGVLNPYAFSPEQRDG
jgi:hypothetical protein